jgi:hypothetical protein
MNPEDLDVDSERDPLLRALAALPREDLDAWRSQRLRTRAHAELARAAAPRALDRVSSAIEPLLIAVCGLLGLGRLAIAIALIVGL